MRRKLALTVAAAIPLVGAGFSRDDFDPVLCRG
jgi:hypothetical protein